MKPETQAAFWFRRAKIAGAFRPRGRTVRPWPAVAAEPGISVVIPSRNGRSLLEAQLAGVVRELERFPSEILVVDNGSGDGTEAWLRASWPQIRIESSPAPLSFSRAVNRGIAAARHSHVCLLNNDMIVEPEFFAALVRAFEQVPGLFSATAQIFFPEGVRREETGKAVYFQPSPADFPIRCDDPIPGEDLTWVLYGSGGCSLYDAAKLRALGSLDESFDPAYVEDLDIGYRGWLHGWPSVYVAGARLEHRHRATSSRYFTEEQLDEILELNYLRFVVRAVASREVFGRLWDQALVRLKLRAPVSRPARVALRAAARIALGGGPPDVAAFPEEMLLAMSAGGVAVFPGRAPLASPRTLVAGGEQRPGAILVTWVDELATPSADLLSCCAEVVQVRRREGPLAFRGVLRQTARKWRAEVAYLDAGTREFAPDCAPAKVV